jgi:hypothetical protein
MAAPTATRATPSRSTPTGASRTFRAGSRRSLLQRSRSSAGCASSYRGRRPSVPEALAARERKCLHCIRRAARDCLQPDSSEPHPLGAAFSAGVACNGCRMRSHPQSRVSYEGQKDRNIGADAGAGDNSGRLMRDEVKARARPLPPSTIQRQRQRQDRVITSPRRHEPLWARACCLDVQAVACPCAHCRLEYPCY